MSDTGDEKGDGKNSHPRVPKTQGYNEPEIKKQYEKFKSLLTENFAPLGEKQAKTYLRRELKELKKSDPKSLQKFKILYRVGEGATAVVYLGKDPRGDLVAIKVLREYVADDEALIGGPPSTGLPSGSTTRPSISGPVGTSRSRFVVRTVFPSSTAR